MTQEEKDCEKFREFSNGSDFNSTSGRDGGRMSAALGADRIGKQLHVGDADLTACLQREGGCGNSRRFRKNHSSAN